MSFPCPLQTATIHSGLPLPIKTSLMKNELDKQAVADQGDQLYDFGNQILMNWHPKRGTPLSTGATSLLKLGLRHGIMAVNHHSETRR